MDELIGHGSSPGLEIEIHAVDAFRDRSEPFEKGGLAKIEEIAAITCSCVIKAAEKPRPFPNLCLPEVSTPDDEKSTFFGPVRVNNKNREFVAGHDRHSEECLRVPTDAAGGKGKIDCSDRLQSFAGLMTSALRGPRCGAISWRPGWGYVVAAGDEKTARDCSR
jgi:hypothetical protein